MEDAAVILILLLVLSGYILHVITRVRRMNRQRRELKHKLMCDAKLCLICGYDLRSSSGRCPECGALIAAHPQAI